MSPFESPGKKSDPARELRDLFEADQQARSNGLLMTDEKLFSEQEKARYRKAQELYRLYENDPGLFTGEMKFDLALLFQHGASAEDYERALSLAQAAERDGFDGSETLVKAAEDRYMLSIGQPQKWGTQTVEGGRHERMARAEILWVKPDIEKETGEIERVSEVFSPDNKIAFQERVKQSLAQAELVDLDEAAWNLLENTDSTQIAEGDFDQVERFALEYGRDDKALLMAMRGQVPMEAPMILRTGATLHLISGNTRLMLARALGQTPKVLIATV